MVKQKMCYDAVDRIYALWVLFATPSSNALHSMLQAGNKVSICTLAPVLLPFQPLLQMFRLQAGQAVSCRHVV